MKTNVNNEANEMQVEQKQEILQSTSDNSTCHLSAVKESWKDQAESNESHIQKKRLSKTKQEEMVGCYYLNHKTYSDGLKDSRNFARSSPKALTNGKHSGRREIWIDGPNVTKVSTPITSVVNMSEIWVDGPNAFSHEDKEIDPQYQSKLRFNLDRTSRQFGSLDRQLLRRLNDHERDLHVDFEESDSRPISLLCESTRVSIHDEPSLHQKLQDLKSGSGQMIFKKSCKEMESLHKTLESFLNLGSNHQIATNPVSSSVAHTPKKSLAVSNHVVSSSLDSSPNDSSSSDTNPYSEPFDNLKKPICNNVNQIFVGKIPKIVVIRGKSSVKLASRPSSQKRLFYNFSSSSPDKFFAEIVSSNPCTPVHNQHEISPISIASNTNTPTAFQRKYSDNPQSVLRLLRQTAHKLTGIRIVTGCTSAENDDSLCPEIPSGESLLDKQSKLGSFLKRKYKSSKAGRKESRHP